MTDPRWSQVGRSFAQGTAEGMYFGAQAWAPVAYATGQAYEASVRQIAQSSGAHRALMEQLQQQAAQQATSIAQTPMPTVVGIDNPVFSIPNIAAQRAAQRERAAESGGTSRTLVLAGAAVAAFVGYRVWRRRGRRAAVA